MQGRKTMKIAVSNLYGNADIEVISVSWSFVEEIMLFPINPIALTYV
jgi:hypothetical protein